MRHHCSVDVPVDLNKGLYTILLKINSWTNERLFLWESEAVCCQSSVLQSGCAKVASAEERAEEERAEGITETSVNPTSSGMGQLLSQLARPETIAPTHLREGLKKCVEERANVR